MESNHNNKNESDANQNQSKKPSDTTSKSESNTPLNDSKPTKRIRRKPTQEQLDNPFHGVKLVQILERLVAYYGWEYLGERVNIRCFIYDPTMKSSLGFLRRTTWAREHVEDLYLEMLEDQENDRN